MELFKKEQITLASGLQCLASKDLCCAIEAMNRSYDSKIAIGEHDNMLFAEMTTPDVISMIVFDSKKGTAKGLRLNPTTRYVESDFDDFIEDRIVALATIITYLESSGHVVSHKINDFMRIHQSVPSDQNALYDWMEALNQVEAAIAIELHNKKSPLKAFSKPIAAINLSQVETGMLTPSKIILGEFKGFKSANRTTKPVSVQEIGNKYHLFKTSDWSEEQVEKIPVIPEYHSISRIGLRATQDVFESFALAEHLRFKNLMFAGIQGAGKSVATMHMAALLNMPLYRMCCNADMDMSSFLEMILPKIEEPMYIPTDDEILFDPVGVYERVTGTEVAPENYGDITESVIRQAIKAEKERRDNAPQKFDRTLSPFVEAFANGGLLEIQEPTLISDPGLLAGLNSAFEEGFLQVGNRTIKRHPNCIIVMTTNVDLAGCKEMNLSFLDRMLIDEVELPAVEERIQMLKTLTGCGDEEFIRKAVEAADALNEYYRNNSAEPIVSMRGLKDLIVLKEFLKRDLRESVRRAFLGNGIFSKSGLSTEEAETFLETSTNLFS